MIIEAFGSKKGIMEWLDDPRIHPEITRDVLVKRIRRSKWDHERALTTPVMKGARKGDTKLRIEARKDKMKRHVRMFKMAQKVRREYDNGLMVEEIMDRHGISKSQVNKISAKMEWYNTHWSNSRTPDSYKVYLDEENVVEDKRVGQ